MEKKAMQYCISKLPSFDDFRQKFYPKIDNWLPFYWAGFEQTTRYTYIIPYEEKKDIKSNYKDSLKRQIAKAKKGCSFEIVDDLLPYEALFNATFKRQNLANPLDFKFLCQYLKTINAHGSGKCVVAKGVDNQPLAIVLVVWDNLSTYYLAGGYDEQYAQTGAMSGLFDLMIEEAQTQKRNFNFEGSMIESIEQYFRSFGAQLQPVMNIWKTNSKVLKTFGKG
ncbi:MAG: GNAT family N-acetyltransferase [Bacteroidetes bacterium]|nr:GNAT family N-acetyltransferase [Bacteroidota bacterium]